MGREQLPNDLLWDDGSGDGAAPGAESTQTDGGVTHKHASELALSAFADGEESLLSNEVILHLHTCSDCAMRLGETALVTRGVTHAVQSVKPWLPATMTAVASKQQIARKRSTQPLPWAAIVGALTLTVVGATPAMLALPHRLATFAVTLLHAAPVVSHSGVQVFQQGLGSQWTQAMGVCAALLIAAGFALTRLLPRPATAS